MVIERVLIRPVEGAGPADARDRHARAVHPRQLGRRLDLGLQQPRLPERCSRTASPTSAASTLSLESLGHRRRAARASSACCGCSSSSTKLGLAMRAAAANPASAPARRHPGRADADDRLGPGRAARRAGRRAGRAAAVPRRQPDGPACSSTRSRRRRSAASTRRSARCIGGWIIGVAETLAGDYIDFIGSDLKILVPLAIIFVVLLVRPHGLFGSPEVVRA